MSIIDFFAKRLEYLYKNNLGNDEIFYINDVNNIRLSFSVSFSKNNGNIIAKIFNITFSDIGYFQNYKDVYSSQKDCLYNISKREFVQDPELICSETNISDRFSNLLEIILDDE